MWIATSCLHCHSQTCEWWWAQHPIALQPLFEWGCNAAYTPWNAYPKGVQVQAWNIHINRPWRYVFNYHYSETYMPFWPFIFNIMKFITANPPHFFELKRPSSIKNNGQLHHIERLSFGTQTEIMEVLPPQNTWIEWFCKALIPFSDF